MNTGLFLTLGSSYFKSLNSTVGMNCQIACPSGRSPERETILTPQTKSESEELSIKQEEDELSALEYTAVCVKEEEVGGRRRGGGG